MRGRIRVQSDRKRIAVLQQSMAEQGFRSAYVPAPAQEEIHRFAILIDGPIPIGLRAGNLDIGLVHAPAQAHGFLESAPTFLELR